MTELWLPVVGYEEFYEVSDLGRIRALPRTIVTSQGVRRTYPGRPISGWLGNHGYQTVSLSRDRVKRKESVHVIVATAFHGSRPGSHFLVCHFDGDKSNNAASNLRWATQSDNLRDAVRHGTHHWAAKTHCPQGHPYSPENTYSNKGRRACRTCYRAHRVARRRRVTLALVGGEDA